MRIQEAMQQIKEDRLAEIKNGKLNRNFLIHKYIHRMNKMIKFIYQNVDDEYNDSPLIGGYYFKYDDYNNIYKIYTDEEGDNRFEYNSTNEKSYLEKDDIKNIKKIYRNLKAIYNNPHNINWKTMR